MRYFLAFSPQQGCTLLLISQDLTLSFFNSLQPLVFLTPLLFLLHQWSMLIFLWLITCTLRTFSLTTFLADLHLLLTPSMDYANSLMFISYAPSTSLIHPCLLARSLLHYCIALSCFNLGSNFNFPSLFASTFFQISYYL